MAQKNRHIEFQMNLHNCFVLENKENHGPGYPHFDKNVDEEELERLSDQLAEILYFDDEDSDID